MKKQLPILLALIFFLTTITFASGNSWEKFCADPVNVQIVPYTHPNGSTGAMIKCNVNTPPATPTATPTLKPTPTLTSTVTTTSVPPTSTPIATNTPVPSTSIPGDPYPAAPLCPDSGTNHDNSVFHTVWDSTRGCHYDHEHGQDPFTSELALAFPDFDLFELLGNVEVGHTNPSSPTENEHKHPGMKWQNDATAPNGCETGFEGGTVAINAYAIQYHAFGPQFEEFETRNHSSVALLRQCKSDNPSDVGYVFTVQLQEYGERCLPYQGQVLQYPDNFEPQWDCAFGQYFTTEGVPLVRPSLDYYNGSITRNNLSIWTSKITGTSNPSNRPPSPLLFRLLFRVRDVYQVLDTNDLIYPFTWLWACTSDNGITYDPQNCRYNNSTTTIHEIKGDIPSAWDNLSGFDTDPRFGRITAEGFTDKFGNLRLDCVTAGGECYPLKLVNAFVGTYSSEVSEDKVSNPNPTDTPERDVYFCNGVVCLETDPGAVPSGWIGSKN